MSRIVSLAFRCALLSMLVFGGAWPALAQTAKTYTLAVNPSAPPVPLHKLWAPFVQRIARETGFDLRIKLYDEMAEFERDIWRGTPDFIYSSPIQLVVAHEASGYVPLLRGAKPVAVGLYVRKDSPVRTIDDLIGKKIAFVGNKNVCSVAMRHLLAEHKRELSFVTEYAGSTRNVMLNVLLGKGDAGAIFLSSFEREPEEVRNQLRAIVTTPEIAPHAFSAHPRVRRADREAVAKAMLALAAREGGAELLRSVGLASPVAADYERDYSGLETIDVKRLTAWGQ